MNTTEQAVIVTQLTKKGFSLKESIPKIFRFERKTDNEFCEIVIQKNLQSIPVKISKNCNTSVYIAGDCKELADYLEMNKV